MKAKDHKIWASPDPKSINKMIDLLFKMMFLDTLLCLVKYIPWTQEMCNKLVHIEPHSLAFIPDHFKRQEMCNEAMRENPAVFFLVPDCFKHKKCVSKRLRKAHCS